MISSSDDDGSEIESDTSEITENENSERQETLKSKYEEREYQRFLFLRALEENVIACLPTGCGKTFIAVEVIKHFLPETLAQNKKIIFVATTVPLVRQQGRYLKDHIGNAYSSSNKIVGIVSGELSPEDWSGEKWKLIISSHTVFSMTDQILRHAVERKHISWNKMSLIVLDECHNAQKNHPMAALMGFYRADFLNANISQTDLPRVLGLTATLVIGNSKAEDLVTDINEIEKKFCARAITYHNYNEVIKCSTSATIEIVTYKQYNGWKLHSIDLSEHLNKICAELEAKEHVLLRSQKINIPEEEDGIGISSIKHSKQIFWKQKNPIKELVKQIKEIIEVLLELGPFCAENCVLMKIAYFRHMACKEKRKQNERKTAELLVLKWLVEELWLVERQIRHFMFYFSPCSDDALNSEDADYVVKFISPKLERLIEILKTTNSSNSNDDLCGIIFCEKRITAQMLCYYIQDLSKLLPEVYSFLNCSFVLGTSGNNSGLIQTVALRKQSEILDNFRQHRLNILVATKVLEEGLNVPSCNFILRFDRIKTFPSFVQSMGRARQQGAKFFSLILEEDKKAESDRIGEYQKFGDSLSKALINSLDLPERYFNSESEVGDAELNQLVPAFKAPNGAMITAGSAIDIVYRYCEGLNCDKLSTLSPFAWWNIEEGLYRVTVRLPPNACVKSAKGGLYKNKGVAKKSAFLEVCKLLYHAGVLSENMLPIPRFLPVYITKYIDNLENLPNSEDGKKIGSKNRFHWYKKKLPNEFAKQPEIFCPLSTYAIQIELLEYFGIEECKPLYNFSSQQYLYGIITTGNLNKVDDFLLLSKEGNFRAHIERVDGITYSEEIIRQIKTFQRLIFSEDTELLNFAHSVLKDSSSSPYYIAPLQKNNGKIELAMDVMHKLKYGQAINYNEPISVTDRENYVYKSDFFSDALLISSYSPSYNEKQKSCVVSVDRSRNPLSPFEDPTKAKNYVEYYKSKYEIEIVNTHQPLIKAKPIAKQLNFLIPKYDWKMNGKERRDAKYASSVITIIPELQRVHPLPGSLFVQLKCLPSCIHRIERLLLANEILESVSSVCALQEQDNARNIRNAEELKQLNEKVTHNIKNKREIIALKSTLNQPTTTLTAATAIYKNTEAVNMFNLKRKLYWVEIEYIHPKDIQTEDLDVSFADEDDDIIMDSLSASPSTVEKTGIELIPSLDVQFQNFDQQSPQVAQPLPSTIMEALTLANGQDYVSLEKLEMMGDSVLKLVTTVHIFALFPEFEEGPLTGLRTRLICNKHLYIIGNRKNLGDFVAGSLFHPGQTFQPPGKTIAKKLQKAAIANNISYHVYSPLVNIPSDEQKEDAFDFSTVNDNELDLIVKSRVETSAKEIFKLGPPHTTYTHSRIGDKSVADCVEAIIGAFYLSGGISGALNFMNWVGLRCPTNERPAQELKYGLFKNLPKMLPNYPTDSPKLIPLVYIEELENLLEYTFENKWLIIEAFTHPSYMDNEVTNGYQRLEFLGDSLLDFLVTDHIYKNQPAINDKDLTPGMLTDLRSALVNNITFASLSVRYGFHKLLLHFSPILQESIDTFVNCQERNNHQVTGAFSLLTESDCVAACDIDVPKALGDIFESLAGAVYLDSLSLDRVWTVFYRLMKNEIDIFSKDIPLQPIRVLHEKFPSEIKFRDITPKDSTRYEVRLEIGKRRSFSGSGKTKKSAKAAAAKFALKSLNEEEKKMKYLEEMAAV